uniref:Uncharacterized protein n=1 Tax=Triticum urartu TaxID=4572 RepID=A0A8R7V0S3_TRIUA
ELGKSTPDHSCLDDQQGITHWCLWVMHLLISESNCWLVWTYTWKIICITDTHIGRKTGIYELM